MKYWDSVSRIVFYARTVTPKTRIVALSFRQRRILVPRPAQPTDAGIERRAAMSELEFIYRVAFNEPPLENDDSWEFYFTSLSAIYEKFTPEQVGCKVSRLWNLKITPDKPYNGRRCRITKEPVLRKKRRK